MYPNPTPSRAATYIRVSSEEQVEGYSLDAQTRAVKLYAEAHDWEIVHQYRDEGKSARSDDLAKRPAFAKMLADAEAGRFDVLVVHKLDRFSRNLRMTLETLERLNNANVAFVSISESMDFSTPIGKVILATLGAFAQYYSDNLSHETKKGKQERKRQGLYNGFLPFGVMKNDGGIPVPNPESYPGLLLAFQSAAEGCSDREVTDILNAAGYRTSGNRGANPFTKDTVRPMLLNRFYLGELPDGEGGWIPGVHKPLIPLDLFEAATKTREARRRSINTLTVGNRHTTYSLSGLCVCGYCGGRLHIHRDRNARPRIYCYQGRQASHCGQKETFTSTFEEQLTAYIASVRLPDDYRQQLVEMGRANHADAGDTESRRRSITNQLERLKALYEWGDIEPAEYQRKRDTLLHELNGLMPEVERVGDWETVATYLKDLSQAWCDATDEQRNELGRTLFETIELKDNRVEAVIPQPDFAPFFQLDYEIRVGGDSTMRKRRGSRTRDQTRLSNSDRLVA